MLVSVKVLAGEVFSLLKLFALTLANENARNSNPDMRNSLKYFVDFIFLVLV